MNGQIEVITGCMFSGKTEELIRRIKRAKIEKKNFLIFKPKIESRYSPDHIVTNDGIKFPCMVVDSEKPEEILDIVKKHNDVDVVAVDEVNLFSRKIVDVCEELAKNSIRVIATGLDLTSWGEPFHPMPELMAKADFVDKLQAVCVKCGLFATRTQKIVDEEPVKHGEHMVLIGGADKYEARCRNCFEISK